MNFYKNCSTNADLKFCFWYWSYTSLLANKSASRKRKFTYFKDSLQPVSVWSSLLRPQFGNVRKNNPLQGIPGVTVFFCDYRNNKYQIPFNTVKKWLNFPYFLIHFNPKSLKILATDAPEYGAVISDLYPNGTGGSKKRINRNLRLFSIRLCYM